MRRRTAAAGLQRVIAEAHEPRRAALSCTVPACRDEVLMAEPILLAIVRRLRADRPISKDAVARVRAALVDAYSPLYLDSRPGALRDWAQVTLKILDDGRE
jgi:hypothetical protein